MMQITRGKIPSAQKVVVYGPEGIGKSTFASHFPGAVFIDTEGSTKYMDVARLPAPTSWSMLFALVKSVRDEGQGECKTLVLDTADWAEQMCIRHICDKFNKSGIEDFAYGKGYIYVKEEFGRLLNLLEEIIDRGMNVVVTAHAKMRKFEQPDEMGAYDRWELKLDKNIAPLIKEWADIVLFANYKVFTVKDEQTNKNKAQGGKRMLYTTHHPCWDAKNRHKMPPELPLDYAAVAPYLEAAAGGTAPAPERTPAPSVKTDQRGDTTCTSSENAIEQATVAADNDLPFEESPPTTNDENDGLPQALSDLMRQHEVAPIEIQQVVGQKGYFPKDMPISDYPPDFVSGVLVAAWPQVWDAIAHNRADDLPF